MPNHSQPTISFTVTGETRETPLEAVREIWRFRALIVELVQRDLRIRYKKRVGGILWSLLPSLMQVAIISLMVNLFLTSPDAGISGYLLPVVFLWEFFKNTILDSAQSMVLNAQLARKIYFPRAILPIVTLLTNLLHFVISFAFMMVYFLVKPWNNPVYPQHLQPKFLLVFPIVLCVGFLALGFGYLLAYLSTLYDDVRFLLTNVLQLLYYTIPVFYTLEQVAARPNIYPIYMLNPIAALVAGFQRALLPPIKIGTALPVAYPATYVAIGCAVSVVVLLLGFVIFERTKWTMMERL